MLLTRRSGTTCEHYSLSPLLGSPSEAGIIRVLPLFRRHFTRGHKLDPKPWDWAAPGQILTIIMSSGA